MQGTFLHKVSQARLRCNCERHLHLLEQVLVALGTSQLMLGCVFAEALKGRAVQAHDSQVHIPCHLTMMPCCLTMMLQTTLSQLHDPAPPRSRIRMMCNT